MGFNKQEKRRKAIAVECKQLDYSEIRSLCIEEETSQVDYSLTGAQL